MATPKKKEEQQDLESARRDLPVSTDPGAALELLRAWKNGDADEQRDTWDYLRRALNEDRLSRRRL